MKQNSECHQLLSFALSAFLAAARSVTLIMQTELSSDPRFAEWYKKKQEEMKNDSDFAFFNGLRIDTIHKKIVKPLYTISLGPFTTSVNGKLEIPIGNVDENGKILPSDDFIKIDDVPHPEIEKPPIKTGFVFEDRPSDDVIELCASYLEKLRNILADWTSSKTGEQSAHPGAKQVK